MGVGGGLSGARCRERSMSTIILASRFYITASPGCCQDGILMRDAATGQPGTLKHEAEPFRSLRDVVGGAMGRSRLALRGIVGIGRSFHHVVRLRCRVALHELARTDGNRFSGYTSLAQRGGPFLLRGTYRYCDSAHGRAFCAVTITNMLGDREIKASTANRRRVHPVRL
jgi:hypothetical protein